MANEHRGEVEFKLKTPDGEPIEFIARPSFKVVADIERTLNQPIQMLFGKGMNRALGVSEIIVIAAIAAKHADRPPAGADRDDFKEKIYDCGIVHLVNNVAVFLGNAITTGEPIKKGARETPKKN